MMLYLLKSSLCLALCLGFYLLWLQREKMHQFKRFFLLGSIFLSFLIPLLTISTPALTETLIYEQAITDNIVITEQVTPEPGFDYGQVLWVLYLAVTAVLTVRLVRNLYGIAIRIWTSKRLHLESATLVLTEEHLSPHTFLNYIFISKKEYTDSSIAPELLTHELTHARQKHSVDILIIESLLLVFWFHPLFYLVKKQMQLNHEFLADDKVLQQHSNLVGYQHLLLEKLTLNSAHYLASNFNYSLTKKRLVMMTSKRSTTTILLKKLAVLPLLGAFVYLFAERVQAQEEPSYEKVIVKAPKPNAPAAQSQMTITYQRKDGTKIVKKFEDLTEAEKAKLPPPPPRITARKVPSKALINKLKDSKTYAIWIDGKPISNKILNRYKNTDFAYHSGSMVHKNARSKRFPQPYQFNLATEKYYRKHIKNRKGIYPVAIKELLPPPPPPHTKECEAVPPPSPLEFVKKMNNKEVSYTYNGKPVSHKKALQLLQKNNALNIRVLKKNGKQSVHISEKPIVIESNQ